MRIYSYQKKQFILLAGMPTNSYEDWNKSNRLVSQSDQEQYILNTINHAMYDIKTAYQDFTDEDIKLYIDTAVQEGYDTEIFMDVNLKHYPLRDYKSVWSEMQSIVKSYGKIGKRNEKAIEHNKLGKHMMHLIRLYMMCLDILEKEKIITYREKEHDLLMDIRNGKYLDSNKQPIAEFYEMVDEYEKRLEYAKENTSLPDSPDYNAINEFIASVNERVVKGEI
jgi:predicted nucleotidyltransferase